MGWKFLHFFFFFLSPKGTRQPKEFLCIFLAKSIYSKPTCHCLSPGAEPHSSLGPHPHTPKKKKKKKISLIAYMAKWYRQLKNYNFTFPPHSHCQGNYSLQVLLFVFLYIDASPLFISYQLISFQYSQYKQT